MRRYGDSGDASRSNIFNISQRNIRSGDNVGGDQNITNISPPMPIVIDQEIVNLLDWLADQQGISREIALKKAVATAAYIQDITTGQGGKLLVKRPDNSVGEIVLK